MKIKECIEVLKQETENGNFFLKKSEVGQAIKTALSILERISAEKIKEVIQLELCNGTRDKEKMKMLFEDITLGLISQGWKVLGGNDDTFLILEKTGKTIKVFADNYKKPNHFIVRYSYNIETISKRRKGE